MAVALALLPASGAVAFGATFIVNDTGDVSDASAGDGVCATAGGLCTLRAAGEEAKALPSDDEIHLPAGTYGVGTTIALSGNTAIVGAGAPATIIDGNGGPHRVLNGEQLTLEGVTVRNSGGVRIDEGTVSDCVFTQNAGVGMGGGLYVWTGTVLRSTFTNNTATTGGGALYISKGVVRDSTFAGNSLVGDPSLAYAFGDTILSLCSECSLLIANSTVQGGIRTQPWCTPPIGVRAYCVPGTYITLSNVTGVTAWAAFVSTPTIDFVLSGRGATVTTRNSIFTGCPNHYLSKGHNLFVSETPCEPFDRSLGDVAFVSEAPPLAPLASNGGPTETRMPLPKSILIGGGGTDCELTDQRGVPRPIGARCDIGAVEAESLEVGCGNGVRDPGETCDDGDLTADDCCDATCQFAAPGSPCEADSNPCTDDVCFWAGECVHPNNTAPCDDDNVCTTDDACFRGVCTGGTVVDCPDPCLECYPDTGCEAPRDTCIDDGTATSQLKIRHTTETEGARLSIAWRTSTPVGIADFLDPTQGTAAQRLCIYDGAGQVMLGASPTGTCRGDDCWSSAPGGFRYLDLLASPDGLHKIRLRGDPPNADSALIDIQGRGVNLPFAAAGPWTLPVRVRFETSNVTGASPETPQRQCFDATFDGRVRSNTTTRFAGKSD